MRVELLWSDDCPSAEPTMERLAGVLAERGIDPGVVRSVRVGDGEELPAAYRGSPTILVDGEDADPEGAAMIGEGSVTACRGYRVADGRISPLPPATTLAAAIDRALARA
jgi:hypothetical protein